MGPTVDAAYIRRAIELADLDAVRVALYQQTHDEELAALPVAVGRGRRKATQAEKRAVDNATAKSQISLASGGAKAWRTYL